MPSPRQEAADNPRSALIDVVGVARDVARLDEAVPAWLRRQGWDLPALVVDCPVPVSLVVAVGPGTALVEPGRSRVLAGLEPERLIEIDGGHGLHRDRPALFLLALPELTKSLT